MKTTAHVDGAVVLRGVNTAADLRARRAAFETLFGVQPMITIEGTFTDTKTKDAVWLRSERRVTTLGRSLLTIELGGEGLAYCGEDDLPAMTIRLRAESAAA